MKSWKCNNRIDPLRHRGGSLSFFATKIEPNFDETVNNYWEMFSLHIEVKSIIIYEEQYDTYTDLGNEWFLLESSK